MTNKLSRRSILAGTALAVIPTVGLCKETPLLDMVEVKVEWGRDCNYWTTQVCDALDDAWARVRNREGYPGLWKPELVVRMVRRPLA